jgi:hypothetical protein
MDAAQHEALWAEAAAIPDPGGPLLGAYADALEAWAASHPEVDSGVLRSIIIRRLRAHM